MKLPRIQVVSVREWVNLQADLTQAARHRRYVRVVRRQILCRYIAIAVAFLLAVTSVLGVFSRIVMEESLLLVAVSGFGAFFYGRVCVRLLQGRSIWGRKPGQ